MKTVVLVTCTKSKHKGRHKAGYIYTKSANYRKYFSRAQKLTTTENIFVISALHGLLPLDKEIDCYDYTLMHKSKTIKNAWGEKVANQIKELFNIDNTNFIVIAGADYFVPLRPHLPNMLTPLKNVGRGNIRFATLDAFIEKYKS